MLTVVIICVCVTLFGFACGAYAQSVWSEEWKRRALKAEKAWECHGLYCGPGCNHTREIKDLKMKLANARAKSRAEATAVRACDYPQLSFLYAEISVAILDAERDKKPNAAKYMRLSRLEATIASILPPESLEGSIARTGAVTAAMVAKHPMRALRLSAAYAAETPEEESLALTREALIARLTTTKNWAVMPAPRRLRLLLPF